MKAAQKDLHVCWQDWDGTTREITAQSAYYETILQRAAQATTYNLWYSDLNSMNV